MINFRLASYLLLGVSGSFFLVCLWLRSISQTHSGGWAAIGFAGMITPIFYFLMAAIPCHFVAACILFFLKKPSAKKCLALSLVSAAFFGAIFIP